MKKWVQKLVEQFGVEWQAENANPQERPSISEATATILHILDIYAKHLIDVEGQPVKKVREGFEEIAQSVVSTDPARYEKGLFRLRQFFTSYRIDEYSYIQKTFDDFKNVIWDFADQLAAEIAADQSQDRELMQSLEQLRDAVESNSIEDLREKSREFIDFYISLHSHRDHRRNRRLESIQQNLEQVRLKLSEATKSAMTDFLTGAYNRRSFDQRIRECLKDCREKDQTATLLTFDIDYFKRINDRFGHDVGDFVLKECVRIARLVFIREKDFIARIGGEEFCFILPMMTAADAATKGEMLLERFRKEAIVTGQHTVRFTASIGIAQVLSGESHDQWLKRADEALYKSKQSGRDRLTIASFVTAA